MRSFVCLAATVAILGSASSAIAAPAVIDGTVSAGEYPAATASVATDPAAPTSNFATPGNTATAGYDIYLKSFGDTLYGAVSQTGGTTSDTFANLYFDLDPTTGTGGPEIGIEVTNRRGFIAGLPGYYDFASSIDFATSTVAGLTTTEFSIENSVFRDFIAAINATPYFGPGGYTEQNVRLSLSQSLGYSVAGGSSYGSAGLGTFSVTAPVPEPATWAMMIAGFGTVGLAMRRRNSKIKASVAYA